MTRHSRPRVVLTYCAHLPGSSLVFESTVSVLPRTLSSGSPFSHGTLSSIAHSYPCSGGILTGKLLSPDAVAAPGSHYDPNWQFSTFYAARFGNANDALRALKATVEKHNLQLIDVAYRWLQHHSALTPTDHGVIIGPSSLAQLEKALEER